MTNLDELQRVGREQIDAATNTMTSIAKGFQTIAAEATEYSRKSMESGKAHVEHLLSANSFEGVVQLQADFARKAYADFVPQTSKMGQLYSSLGRQALRPPAGSVATDTKKPAEAPAHISSIKKR